MLCPTSEIGLTDILRLPDSAGHGSHDRPFISRSQTLPQPDDNLTLHHVPSRLLSDSRNPQTGKLHPRCTPFYFSTQCHLFTTPQTAKRWSGSLGVWGVGAGTALVFVRPSPQFSYAALSEPPFCCQLLSVTPKVKNTLLLNIPVVRPPPFPLIRPPIVFPATAQQLL